MTVHVALDPNATGTAVFPARPEWLTLSAALADEVGVIADRDDLLVTIAPGAGGGAPACFYPTRALIEVDGVHLGVDPATVDPADPFDRGRYATAWGLLTHECAHAAHSVWDPPDGTPPGIVDAATLLEESRMEAAHVRRRPDDRLWLRASAVNLILNDTDATDPALAPRMTTADAAHTAALILARVDGGILTAAETAPVADAVETILGAPLLDTLRGLWRESLATADDDADTMIDIAQRWCQAVGTDPDDPAPARGGPGNPAPPGAVVVPSALATAITTTAATVAAAVATETPIDPAAIAAAAQADEDAAREAADKAARTVFSSPVRARRTGSTATTGTRPPTAAERNAARVLGRALSTAGVRDRVPVKTTSPFPPGRLRMRGVLASDAQRAAGADVTAEPFTRTTRRAVPTPPLKLAVACDVSGSMGHLRKAVASTAWILAHGGRHATVDVTTATVIFGRAVRPITHPGAHPAHVNEFAANDGCHAIATAADALDGALGLSRPGAARLLVIISDGHFDTDEQRDGKKRIDRLRASGCAVLWLTTNEHDQPFNGVTVHQLTDPATAGTGHPAAGSDLTWTTTAQAIGRAATAALRATH
ncbi:vWA domain-containing protein [Actinokineospora diospyrosa]|uniref:VWA domain containing CoxE-like protein n=1 Tax=Actinokineospora diospyrosa TaxID=103728 RepID=A0ABT1I9C8_9PSEU|nr:vWA domain-containing protein [Actinokineospora diospyrosa]MCP2269232.1 VWA domain containing CoxE-like protein [Actinokineospora diospyrosa]